MLTHTRINVTYMDTRTHTHTCTQMANVVMIATNVITHPSHPQGITQWHFESAFPGTRLETHSNTLIAPLAWCWHSLSNLDFIRLLALPMGLMFLPIYATPAEAWWDKVTCSKSQHQGPY